MSIWNTVPFSNIADFKNGLNFKSGETGYALKVLGVGDFQNRSSLDQVNEISTVHTEKEIDSSYHLQDGDLVFVRSNGNKALVGRCMLVHNLKEKISFSGFTIRARLTSSNVLPAFVNLLMQAGILKKELKRDSRGTNISNLNQAMLSKLEIPLIRIDQQKEILNFFTNWNTAISKTEALIDAKERQFGWLAAKLIREQTSHLSKLSDHFGRSIAVEKGKPLIKANIAEDGTIPVVAGGKTSPYSHDQSTHSIPCITVSASGAHAGYVWFHDYPIWASDCNVIYSTDHLTEYLYFALKLKQSRIYAFQSGGGQPHVYARDLKNIAIPLPPLAEQKRIAETLNTAKQEINLLKKLANQYRTQKRALMQKLLSGESHIKKRKRLRNVTVQYTNLYKDKRKEADVIAADEEDIKELETLEKKLTKRGGDSE